MNIQFREIEETLTALLKWLKKIEEFPLDRLKSDPIFTTKHRAVNVLAHEIHLLKITSKKKEEKLHFLSEFFESFSTLKRPEDIITHVFQLLYKYMDNSDAVIYLKRDESYYPMEESLYGFLNQSFSEDIFPIFFPNQQEIGIFNSLSTPHPVYDFYSSEDALFLEGAHCMYVRVYGYDYVMCFFRSFGSAEFNNFDHEFVQGIVDKIRTLIANLAQLHREVRMVEELKTAAAVQQALFPRELPQFDNLRIATHFRSATETGGDWYGFIRMGRTLATLIGDVTGHGTPAALVTAAASAACNMIQQLYYIENRSFTPCQILQYLNPVVWQAGRRQYLMTFFVATIDIDSGSIRFANAGHNFPILVRKGTIKRLLNTNLRLGDQQDCEFTESSMQLEPNDLLFLFTDGVIENENQQGEMWGERQLTKLLHQTEGQPVEQIINQIVQEAYHFYDSQPLDDDVTLVALKYG